MPWLSSQPWQDAHQQSQIPMSYQQRVRPHPGKSLGADPCLDSSGQGGGGRNLLLVRPGPVANFWLWDLQEPARPQVRGSELDALARIRGKGRWAGKTAGDLHTPSTELCPQHVFSPQHRLVDLVLEPSGKGGKWRVGQQGLARSHISCRTSAYFHLRQPSQLNIQREAFGVCARPRK